MIHADHLELLEYLRVNVRDLNFCIKISRKMAPWMVKKKNNIEMAAGDVDCKNGKWMELTRFGSGVVEPPELAK